MINNYNYTIQTIYFMKKLSLQCIVLLFITSALAFGQDTIKTPAGRWSTEVNINPLQGQISLNNAINQIKVRYFTVNNVAFRLAFSLNNNKMDDGAKSSYGTNPTNDTEVKKSTTFGLNLGFEQHLNGTRRLSPYIGAEIAFGLKSANETSDDSQGSKEIKGGWINYQMTQYYDPNYGYRTVSSSYIVEKGYTSFGANLVVGFDYYIASHLFIGYEFLYGFNYVKYDDIELTYTPKIGQSNPNNDYPTISSKVRSFGAKIVNGIRLGYTF